ncbi:MAG: protein translocase subunit SecD [Marmoricola sp.]
MANKASRPGRTLLIFTVCVGVLYGLVALGGVWSPKLGLDLKGGTRITLTAQHKPSPTKLTQASSIISQRVNGSGVTESTVTTQGGRNIVVEIPGQNAQDLVNRVKKTAQLRFRLVAYCPQVTGGPCQASSKPQPKQPAATPSSSPSGTPSGAASPSSSPSPGASGGTSSQSKSGSRHSGADHSAPRPATGFAVRDGSGGHHGKARTSPTSSPSSAATGSPTPSPTPTGHGKTVPGASFAQPQNALQQMKWTKNPGTDWQLAFAAAKCHDGEALVPRKSLTMTGSVPPRQLGLKDLVPERDVPSRPRISCDKQGNKLLMGPAVIEGTQLGSASAGQEQNQQSFGQWIVQLSFKSAAADTFSALSRAMWKGATAYHGTYANGLFAIVLDGDVLQSPGFDGVIPNGEAQISGGFTQHSAQALANNLKYGALPVKFNKDVSSQVIGPSLAGNQLSAGLLAAAIGLLLVMLYCLLYYRGLGTVVVSSLIVAAIVTYGVVLVLAKAAGFTLSLPGIAGLIVAVGITADSFIVYFERIRDEMRDGKSMRVAVQLGWPRARNTCLAADAVSVLAAVVLYIFAIDVVRGFAFALGISTLIDVVVFFVFTHPVITILSGHRFFNAGHRLSGLSKGTLGVDEDALAEGRA